MLFFLLSAGYLYFATEIRLDFWSEEEAFNARSMPYFYGSLALCCSALLILLPAPTFDWQQLRELHWKPAALVILCTSTFGLIIEAVGFIFASSLFLITAFAILGERHWIRMLLVGFGLAICFWLLMDKLGIYLSPGELWQGFTDD